MKRTTATMITKLMRITVSMLMIFSLHVTQFPEEAHPVSTPHSVLLIIENDIYSAIATSISQYITDLEAEGYTVYIHQDSSGTPTDIKNTLITHYNNYGISGAVFIGDIAVATYEIDNDFPGYDGGYGYTSFPIDLFYMDLDGTWSNSDGDSHYDGHSDGSGDMDPEIWIGRLLSSKINNSGEDEVSLLQNYFAKNHAYRTGQLSVQHRGLTFHDDDWDYWTTVNLNNVYSDVTVINDTEQTNATNYENKLQENYEWIHVSAHSNASLHRFSTAGGYTYVYSSEIQSLDPTSLFYNLFACSNARYTLTNYMGGRYIFTNTYGLLSVGCTKTGSMLNFSYFYPQMGIGLRNNIGDAYRYWFTVLIPASPDGVSWWYGMTVLGDPTLTVDPPMASIDSVSADIVTEGTSVTFDGSGSSHVNSISGYEWRSDLDGYLDNRASFSTSYLSIGTHTIYFKVQDDLGRWSAEQTTTVTVEADEARPDVTITSPSEGATVSHEGFTFTGSASGIAAIDGVYVSVQRMSDGLYTARHKLANYDSQTQTWNYPIQAYQIPPGTQVRLWVRAQDVTDTYSLWSTCVVNVDADTGGPTVTMTDPIASQEVSNAGFTLSGTAQDSSGVAGVYVSVEDLGRGSYTVNDLPVSYNSTMRTWGCQLFPAHVTPGAQARLLVRAQDKQGNYCNWVETIVNVADLESQAPTLIVNQPAPDSTVSNGGFTFSGTATDASGVRGVYVYVQDFGHPEYAYSIKNLKVSYNGTTKAWTLNVQPVHMTPGAPLRLVVRALDKAGNYCDWQSFYVNVEDAETDPPTVVITTPADNDTVSNAGFAFSGTSIDASGVDSVWVSVQDFGRGGIYTVDNFKASYNGTTKVWNFNVFPVHITPGAQARLWVRALDKVGNYSDWQSIIVNVEPLP